MNVTRVQTPHGVLEVSLWIVPGCPDEVPAGTVRVRTPEGYFKSSNEEGAFGDFVPGEYMTIDDMVDLRIDLLVLPDGTPESYSMDFNIFYPLPEQGTNVMRYPVGEDQAKVIKVAVDAAASVRDEQFLLAASRAVAMEAHFTASKTLYHVRAELERAEQKMKGALEQGQALGLEEHMAAQERELEKHRK